MSDKDQSREEANVSPAPGGESAAGKSSPAPEEGRHKADQCHGRYLDQIRESLAAEGEVAYGRWGMPLFHSLSDEEAEAQRAALGFAPQDALDFYNRGCLLASREDYAGAAKAFDRAAQKDPKGLVCLVEAVHNRALALEQAGDKTAARATWQAWLTQFGDSEDVAEVKQHLETLSQA